MDGFQSYLPMVTFLFVRVYNSVRKKLRQAKTNFGIYPWLVVNSPVLYRIKVIQLASFF